LNHKSGEDGTGEVWITGGWSRRNTDESRGPNQSSSHTESPQESRDGKLAVFDVVLEETPALMILSNLLRSPPWREQPLDIVYRPQRMARWIGVCPSASTAAKCGLKEDKKRD
jgi:hypothetical protein